MFMKWHVPWGEEGAQVTGKQPLTLACPLSMLVTRKTEQLLAVSRLSCSGGIFPLSGALWSQSRVQGGVSAVRVKRRIKEFGNALTAIVGKTGAYLEKVQAESMGEERRVS